MPAVGSRVIETQKTDLTLADVDRLLGRPRSDNNAPPPEGGDESVGERGDRISSEQRVTGVEEVIKLFRVRRDELLRDLVDA